MRKEKTGFLPKLKVQSEVTLGKALLVRFSPQTLTEGMRITSRGLMRIFDR